jgi:hypothetical protein
MEMDFGDWRVKVKNKESKGTTQGKKNTIEPAMCQQIFSTLKRSYNFDIQP